MEAGNLKLETEIRKLEIRNGKGEILNLENETGRPFISSRMPIPNTLTYNWMKTERLRFVTPDSF
ncbi:MAG TPA: hypothetical protein PK796_02800 [Bacteroidales bacterium]|jgi:hypothetical protein|nr:hypothetical protein [Bacteroidales bacterium]